MAARIRLKSMANFSKQAAVSLRAGLTLSRAFPIISKESRDARLRGTLEEISADIAAGKTLAEALHRCADRFSPIFVEMVSAGERTGHLDEVFERLTDYFDMRLKLRRAVIRASIYPAIQLSAAFMVFSLIITIFSSDKMAMLSRIAFTSTAFFVLAVAVFLFFSRTAVGRGIWDRFVLLVPVFRSVTIKLCMARFTRTLAMQLESAIPMSEAIERSALVTGNGTMAKSLRKIADPIRSGTSLAEAVQGSGYMPPMIREVLVVGEEVGDFTGSLDRVAEIYEEESLTVLETLPKFIGPVVVVIVGVVVLYLFITVYFDNYLKPMLDIVGG